MEIFKETPKIDWIGQRYKFFVVSGILVAASFVSLATKGLNYGIEFTGGSLIQASFEESVSIDSVRADVSRAGYEGASIQQFSNSNTFAIRLKASAESSAELIDKFVKDFESVNATRKFRVDKKEYIGPVVGRHLYRQALIAVILSLVGILVYVAFRFDNALWGVGGILALAQDVITMFGLYSILGLEFDLTAVAAVLTVAGFSINDTIVIFDRMREKLRSMYNDPLEAVINASLNETMSRTIITSGTVFMTVLALDFLGGPGIRGFSIAMTWGVLEGIYSTIAIATPFVFQWTQMRGRGKPPQPVAAPVQGPRTKRR
ncbi:MAG: protein translocase subunit SecF [Elusimicrobiota bacterium]